MTLYYSPGACSLSPHIVLREAGLEHTLEKVNLHTKQTASGDDFLAINPKGSVPTLQLNDGTCLTEGTVIVQYLADLVPAKKLAAPAGTMERYRLMETLGFISTEIHKNFIPFFNPTATDEAKEAATKTLTARFGLIAKQLGSADFLGGSQFTVADAYLFVMLTWTARANLSFAEWPNLQDFKTRVAARPAVHAAMVAEGLVKE